MNSSYNLEVPLGICIAQHSRFAIRPLAALGSGFHVEPATGDASSTLPTFEDCFALAKQWTKPKVKLAPANSYQ